MIRCPSCNNQYAMSGSILCCPICQYRIPEENGIIRFTLPESDEYFFPVESFSHLYEHEADHFWFRSRNEIIGSFIERYMPRNQVSEKRFCEVGCGTGLVSQYLTRKGYRVSCCDLYLEGLLFARERKSGEQYFQCNLYDFPFCNEFDLILAGDVLEHLDDDVSALSHLYDALKPGGFCLITVPAGESLWSVVDLHAGHKRRYDAEGLRKKVSQAGFTLIRLSYFMTVPYPILWIKRTLGHCISSQEDSKGEVDRGMSELNIPNFLNELLYISLLPERRLIQSVNLPFGSSLICVARKEEGKLFSPGQRYNDVNRVQ